MSPDEQEEAQPEGTHLPRHEVGRRASAGMFFIASSGAILLVVGFVGNLVLARLLTPDDFGIVALGLTVITLATTLADGGLAAALIRREAPPTRGELRSLTGLQLLVTLAISLVAVAVALNFGEAGLMASVMIVALPLSSFQVGGRVLIIRHLEFWRTSVADMFSMVAFYVWSITTAALGIGAWSMTTGTVVRMIVATGAIIALSPAGLLLPARPQVRRLLPEIRFGIRFQLAWFVNVIRDQLLNVSAAALGGVAALGNWTLVVRLMQAPALLFQALWQVAYPSMAHLLAGKHEPRPILERATRLSCVAGALILAPFAAATPLLIAPVFGTQWDDAAGLLPLSCLALLIIGPVSVAANGYLNAANRPGDLVRVTGYATIVSVPLAVALLPSIGILALGFASVANALIESVLFHRYVRDACGARLLGRTALPVAIGIAATGIALAAESVVESTIAGAAAAGFATLGLTLLGLLIGCRDDLVDTLRLGAESARNVLGRRGRRQAAAETMVVPVDPVLPAAHD